MLFLICRIDSIIIYFYCTFVVDVLMSMFFFDDVLGTETDAALQISLHTFFFFATTIKAFYLLCLSWPDLYFYNWNNCNLTQQTTHICQTRRMTCVRAPSRVWLRALCPSDAETAAGTAAAKDEQ